jgi:ppGpp synthetase/RelA/SpoT-type nucleotidyltranferase
MSRASNMDPRERLQTAWKKYETRISAIRLELKRLMAELDRRQKVEKVEFLKKRISKA